MRRSRTFAFWPVLLGLLALDCATKELAVDRLTPVHVPHPVIGDLVRFTLTYNPDAAMGLSLGQYSRITFGVIAGVMLCGLGFYYRRVSSESGMAALALGLIGGGAAGNMMDRVRSSRGVVDFIDVGIGGARFYAFNVADAGVFCGTLLLLFALMRRDHRITASASSD